MPGYETRWQREFIDWNRLTDEELIATYRDSRACDRAEALEELFSRQQGQLLRWCFGFTHDRESARDLAQEILLRAYRKLDHFRGESRFSTWLYVIARNVCINAFRKRVAEPLLTANAITSDLPDPRATDIHSAVESEQSRLRNWGFILDTLDRTEAEVMLLHYGEELSLNAVSQKLGLANKCGAKAYIVSARRKLNAAKSAAQRSFGTAGARLHCGIHERTH
jgi:RNA polymerase sigma-70 factor (ECF subfamily)